MNNNIIVEQVPLRFIQLICEKDSSKYTIDARIILFSKYLAGMEPQNNDKAGCMMTLYLPTFLNIQEQSIILVIKFMKYHNFNPQSVRISRIGKYQNNVKVDEMDSISSKFISTKITNLSIQKLKSLVIISEYLKIDLLKGVLCMYLATLHFKNYDQIQIRSAIKEKGIQYSRQEQINLTKRMKRYAQQTSRDLLQKMIQKLDNTFNRR